MNTKRFFTFTPENRAKCRLGTKTMTRRIYKPGRKPRYQIGDVVGMPEPIRAKDLVVSDGVKNPLFTVVGCEYSDTAHEIRREWRWGKSNLSSMHMPASFARTFFRITEYRVERLQAITEADAIREGVESIYSERIDPDWSICHLCGGTGLYMGVDAETGGATFDLDCYKCDTHVKRFSILWNSINSKHEGHAWNDNPEVEVYGWELLKHQPPGQTKKGTGEA